MINRKREGRNNWVRFFKVGELALLENMKSKKSKGDKLVDDRLGPYKILRLEGSADLQSNKSSGRSA